MSHTPVDVPAWQKGVATPKGAQLAYQQTQRWFDEGRVILTIDAKNAFNEILRKAVQSSLLKRRTPTHGSSNTSITATPNPPKRFSWDQTA